MIYKCNNTITLTFAQALAQLSKLNQGKVFKLTLQGWVFCASKKQKAQPTTKVKVSSSKTLVEGTKAFALTRQALKGAMTKVVRLVKDKDAFDTGWQAASLAARSAPCKLHCLHQTTSQGCSHSSFASCTRFNKS